MKFSLCIDAYFPDIDFYDRIPLAAELGFDSFEFWDLSGKDIARIARLSAAQQLPVSICGLNDGWKHNISGEAEVILPNLELSMKLAQDIGSPSLILLTGNGPSDDLVHKKRIIANLQRAAELAERYQITLCLEALNTRYDHPGYFLNSSALGFDILRQVSSPYARLLFDIYHMQIMEGDLIRTIQNNVNAIGHFHSAGVPGRHELFNSENDYPNILKAIEAAGYARYFGLEYWPTYEQKQSIKDVMEYLRPN